MFLGDKGKPNKFSKVRYNYEIIIDKEKWTVSKLAHNLGFYSISFAGKNREIETIYDTERNLLTSSGLIIRKKSSPERTYFSLVRISSIKDTANREKKSFLGECEPMDRPSDFPVQIADAINKAYNNLFTVNVVDIVKHCQPYLELDIRANAYNIISGTGYHAEIEFETMKIRDARTGRKTKKKIVSLQMELDPAYEKERKEILAVIDRHCKELLYVNRNRFEIAEVAIHPPIKEVSPEERKKNKKEKKEKEQEEA